MNNKSNNNDLINLSILSSVLFIIGSFVSLSITFNEKKEKKIYSNTQALNISYYNRILILIAVLISLYVGYNNYKNTQNNTISKYKSSLLLTTNFLTLISSLIILYVSYLNKEEQSLNISDVENPLI